MSKVDDLTLALFHLQFTSKAYTLHMYKLYEHVYLPLCAAPMRSHISTEDVALKGDSIVELYMAVI